MPKPPTTKTTEVVATLANGRRLRRRFSTEEKLRILAEADPRTGRGEVAALLRREGIYSSHLSTWRSQIAKHGAAGLDAKAPGRKATRDERDSQIAKLEREEVQARA